MAVALVDEEIKKGMSKNLANSIDGELFEVQVTADLALTVCRMAQGCAESGCDSAKGDTVNSLYILEDMLKKIDKQIDDVKTKYFYD